MMGTMSLIGLTFLVPIYLSGTYEAIDFNQFR